MRTPDPGRAVRAPDPAAAVAGLAVIALAPLAVAILRLFPPLWPDAHGVGWLLPVAGVLAAAVVAACMTVCLAVGLRDGSERLVLRSAGLGLLAVGLGVAALRALSAEGAATYPDGGASAAAVAGGLMLLLAQLSGRHELGFRRWTAVWVLLFVALEAGLAASLMLSPPDWARPWLMGTAAALVAASALPGPWLAAGLVTGGLAALAAARPGSIDSLPGLVAVAAGSFGYLRAGSAAGGVQEPAEVVRAAPGEPGEPASRAAPGEAAAPDEPDELLREPPPIVVPPVDRSAAEAAADEASRLARELRGTIDELLHARRTIELQREEIAQAAAVDPLTGVASRRAILDRLRIEASEARRYQHPVAVMLLDLDDFGQLNHAWGMSIGDEVLREVALRLRLRVRSADALGRVGGDSFLALLPHTDETGAATFADALRRRLLSRPIETSAGEVPVGVSIGVAFMRAGAGLTDEEILAAADEALASARFAGGNRIAFDRAHGLARLEERHAEGEEQSGA